ncbi:MAG: site-specific integrase [Ignavibacteriae bacterium]|nr:site-specific integrase [Ignavibacteriota bacterium]
MNKFSVNFYLQKVTKENDKVYNFILISVAWNSFRVRTTLKIHIEEILWDAKKQRAKISSKNPAVINEKLDKIRNTLRKLYEDIEREQSRYPTVKEVKALLDQVINNKPPKQSRAKRKLQIQEYFEKFINETESGERLSNDGKQIGHSTLTSYNTTKNHLEEFMKVKKVSLTFDDINDTFFVSMTQFLSEKKLSNNSQGRFFKIIKTFMHDCFNKGLHTNIKFVKALKVFDEETTKIALNAGELEAIQKLTNLTPKLEKLRDLFLVQLYTGIRFSDMKNLKPENLNYQEKVITIYTVKTQDPIVIPMIKKLQDILEHYKGKLPMVSSQKYNEGLKELCKAAEIDTMIQLTHYIGNKRIDELKPKYELVSSHTARRSFITLSLVKGILPEHVMSVSGHKSRKSFQRYVRVTQKEAIDEVRSAWE